MGGKGEDAPKPVIGAPLYPTFDLANLRT